MVKSDVSDELRWEGLLRVEEFGESVADDVGREKPCARAGGIPMGLEVL